jgi:membrane-bound inhibitor of C-type lysozyme
MERYFILMLVAMLVGVTKKNKQEAHFRNYNQAETRTFVAVPAENGVDYADASAINAWSVGNEASIYKANVNDNSTPKIAKKLARAG